MRLSTKGRYAVMAMVDLAQHSGGDPISLAEIAERQEISLSYLEQLFAMLRKGGLVKSVRGPGGGYLLAHHRGETRIADIILAVDEPIRATRCTPGAPIGCRGNQTRCATHDLWEELGNLGERYRVAGAVLGEVDHCHHGVTSLGAQPHRPILRLRVPCRRPHCRAEPPALARRCTSVPACSSRVRSNASAGSSPRRAGR